MNESVNKMSIKGRKILIIISSEFLFFVRLKVPNPKIFNLQLYKTEKSIKSQVLFCCCLLMINFLTVNQ